MSADEEVDLKRLDEALNLLSEHFDSVQIFATRHESGEKHGTINCQNGVGNWFARYGQIETWLIKQRECSKIDARKDNDG